MFIVLDAIDGAGKGRQREEIAKVFKVRDIKFKTAEFPIHNTFYKTVIHPALQEEVKMNSASWVLSYLLDKTLEAPTISKFVGTQDTMFLSDGYFTTTIAYQSFLMRQVSFERLSQYAIDFEIPKPDLAIYLDVDPKIAMERKSSEEGHEEGLDIFEKSIRKQQKLRDIYKRMVRENLYCDWVQIDGSGSVQDVTNLIINALKRKGMVGDLI